VKNEYHCNTNHVYVRFDIENAAIKYPNKGIVEDRSRKTAGQSWIQNFEMHFRFSAFVMKEESWANQYVIPLLLQRRIHIALRGMLLMLWGCPTQWAAHSVFGEISQGVVASPVPSQICKWASVVWIMSSEASPTYCGYKQPPTRISSKYCIQFLIYDWTWRHLGN
jgi:hypothetical protein